MKKVVRIVILSVFAFCLSIACKNYTEDIEDYLSYWSAGVSIAEYRFEPQPQIYTEGMQYVSSKAPVTVTFTVHNSKNLHLKMPGDSDAPADIISFPHIPDAPDKRVAAPQSGNDYEFKKISNTELKLTYNPAFLQKYEWGRGDITPSIILYTTDGRVFKQNIPFKLNVNTPPPAIAECVIGQTETAPPSETCYYVLCLQLSDDDMKKTCGNGLLHGDIAGVEINGTIYRLSVAGPQKQLNVQGNSSFIDKDKVKKLDTIDAKEIPSDWTLYFKTKVKVKPDSPETEYTVKLKDAKGLYSEPVTVSTQGKIVTLTLTELKIHGQNASTGSVTLPYTITQVAQNNINLEFDGHPGLSFTVTPTLPLTLTPGTPQNITIKVAASPGNYLAWEKTVRITRSKNNVATLQSFKLNGEAKTAPFTTEYTVDSGTATVTDFTFGAGSDGAIATVSPADNNIPIGTGKSFTITVTAQDDTVKQTIMFTVKRRTYNVVYSVDGGVGGTIQANSGSPITTNSNISVEYDGSVTFTATPSGGWEVEKWMLDGNEVPGHTNTSYTLSNVTGNKTVKVKFKKKQGIIDGNTETHAWKELRERVAAADDDAVITVKNAITASAASGNNGEIVINKNITIQGTGRTSEKLDAASLSRIFRVKDGKALTLKNITLTGGNTKNEQGDKNGGGVYIENGSCTMVNVLVVECTADAGGAVYVNEGTFSISGDTRITPSTREYEQTAGKNDVYLKNGKVITVTGTLTGTTPIARITPERYPTSSTPTVTVLEGSTVNTEYTKFKVTDEAPTKKWKINASGELEAVGGQSPAIEATSWEDLRTKVQSASDGTVIEVTQDITYGFTSVNSIIEVKKNITIKSKGSNKYTLDANGKGADREQSNDKSIGIFEVSGGKTLTLEKLILTKTEKYAIYVAEGDNSLTMKNVTIKDCKTKDNAAGIYFNKGKTLTLENCTIEKCNGNGGLSSGGIEIQAPTEPVSIKDTTIENCKAIGSDTTGGGIHLWNGQCTLENVTVDNCSAKKGGGMCVKKSTLTITGGSFTKNEASGSIANGGGGAIYSEDSTVTITGCTIGGDNPSDGNSAGQGGGIFVSEDARCTLNAGTKISGNKAIRIEGHNSSGGGIFVDKAKSGTQAGTLTINRSSGNPVIISKNTADYGGGVYNYGTATINHAEIKDNNVQYHGGGMFNAGTCTMDGVTLQNNKAKSEGGGIYSNKELTLKNTTVTGNEATTSGGAIQIATGSSVFNMSGSTVITVDPSKNDIYLTNDAFITLTGELTATKKIARITLNSSGGNGYKADRVVVKGGSGFNITADYKNKFTITDKIGNPQHWKLIYQSNALKLKKN
ncbi:right-handed parallel beta-helix repeat-containing protein [uncultured Treponema sp.]|uniref:right-handed parallel beta-helix repeat-containing protein n=1 Tax=uncultured Treponema sp. TaxID=162155 RepID=UPI0028E1DE22|nr:right-handed parallel beta-helix repeat-containing protein [uncultured Treponema sp.]